MCCGGKRIEMLRTCQTHSNSGQNNDKKEQQLHLVRNIFRTKTKLNTIFLMLNAATTNHNWHVIVEPRYHLNLIYTFGVSYLMRLIYCASEQTLKIVYTIKEIKQTQTYICYLSINYEYYYFFRWLFCNVVDLSGMWVMEKFACAHHIIYLYTPFGITLRSDRIYLCHNITSTGCVQTEHNRNQIHLSGMNFFWGSFLLARINL